MQEMDNVSSPGRMFDNKFLLWKMLQPPWLSSRTSYGLKVVNVKQWMLVAISVDNLDINWTVNGSSISCDSAIPIVFC